MPRPTPLRRVPNGGLVLVAGVDVQDNRFEIVVWAIGRGFELANRLHRAARRPCKLGRLAPPRRLPHHDSRTKSASLSALTPPPSTPAATLRISSTSTCAPARPVESLPSRASRGTGSHRGRIRHGRRQRQWQGHKNGLRLWRVGTDTAKDLIFSRLRLTNQARIHPPLERAAARVLRAAHQRAARRADYRPRHRLALGQKSSAAGRSARLHQLRTVCRAPVDLHRWTEAMWDRQALAVCPPWPTCSSPRQAQTRCHRSPMLRSTRYPSRPTNPRPPARHPPRKRINLMSQSARPDDFVSWIVDLAAAIGKLDPRPERPPRRPDPAGLGWRHRIHRPHQLAQRRRARRRRAGRAQARPVRASRRKQICVGVGTVHRIRQAQRP